MFNWFRRLFSDAPFTDSERKIFRYWNGSRWVWADPLVVQRELRAACPNWADLVRSVRTGGLIPAEALSPELRRSLEEKAEGDLRRLVSAVRLVFAADAVEGRRGRGLSESECLRLLNEWVTWMADLAEEAQDFPRPPRPSGSGPAASPTGPTADSSSTPPPSASGGPPN